MGEKFRGETEISIALTACRIAAHGKNVRQWRETERVRNRRRERERK